MSRSKPPTILYIASSPHSGSTLMDMLLGSFSDITSLGELAFYSIYREEREYKGLLRTFICGARDPFYSCPFWKPTFSNSDCRTKKHFTFLESTVIFFCIIFPFLTKLFHKILDSAVDDTKSLLLQLPISSKYVVDSSKDPRRLFLLIYSGLNVIPIHLVRDGRAVAESYSGSRRKEEFSMQNESFIKHLFLWIGLNTVFHILRRRYRGILISYDQFCDSPVSYLNILRSRLGTPTASTEEELIQDTNGTVYHTIDGSYSKFKKIKRLSRSTGWMNRLSIGQRVLSLFLITPFNVIWVYSRAHAHP